MKASLPPFAAALLSPEGKALLGLHDDNRVKEVDQKRPRREEEQPGKDGTIVGIGDTTPAFLTGKPASSVGKGSVDPSVKKEGTVHVTRGDLLQAAESLSAAHKIPVSRLPVGSELELSSPIPLWHDPTGSGKATATHTLSSGAYKSGSAVSFTNGKEMWNARVFPSANPASRNDALYLTSLMEKLIHNASSKRGEEVDEEEEEEVDKVTGEVLPPEIKRFHRDDFSTIDAIMVELSRQSSAHCLERGLLVERLRYARSQHTLLLLPHPPTTTTV